jgi:hypothetical protein
MLTVLAGNGSARKFEDLHALLLTTATLRIRNLFLAYFASLRAELGMPTHVFDHIYHSQAFRTA